MSVTVRPARASDVPAIDALFIASFPAPAEAALVRDLCVAGDMVLMMVAIDEAVSEEAIVGVVAFSRMAVDVGGNPVPAVALAPVAVEAGYRRQGIAEAVINAGLERLEKEGVLLCFVLGDPAFYGRFGFDPAVARGFESPYAGEYLMALPLQGGLLPCGVRGRADHAPAFAKLA